MRPFNVALQTPSSLRFDMHPCDDDDGLSAFAHLRPRLLGIAHRMLGSAADAEDVVQNVWLSWQCTNRSVVENPSAFLATTTRRLCINLSQSARSRRETHSGTWHREPVDTSGDPGLHAEREEALNVAMLLLLEALSPPERAAYILREAFDYSHRQIADILQMEDANVRQLVSRARKHVTDAFMAAAHTGDMAALEGLFVEEVVSHSASAGILRSYDGCSGRCRRKARSTRRSGMPMSPAAIFSTGHRAGSSSPTP
jgi:RNA polymerase sigma factor (sigma-70 family)